MRRQIDSSDVVDCMKVSRFHPEKVQGWTRFPLAVSYFE